MPMWVRLLQDKKVVDLTGNMNQYHKYDWIEIGKQTALLWLSQGIADKPGFSVAKEYIDITSGIVYVGNAEHQNALNLAKELKDISIKHVEKPEMIFSENMIIKGTKKIRPELIPIGFRLLENFQIAMPIHSLDELAIHIATDDQKPYLQAILRDLRVPVYNTNLIFVRRCEDTQKLFELWELEKQKGLDDRLAFHIAYYQTKPVMCALPVSWI